MAAMLAAGVDGIDHKFICRPDLNDVNIYELTPDERKALDIDELPGSLAEAMRELERDQIIMDVLGQEMYESFQRAKWAEVEEYRLKITDWELERYLEIA
jgi:glutamine synthetase